jgi:hypothetical protein
MNRKMIWLNVALTGLIVLLGWQLRVRRQQTEAQQRAVLLQPARKQAVFAPPQGPPVRPVTPADYIDTAQKMLFAKDRNPNVIVEVPPPPPPPPPPPKMPDLPYYYGQLRFGGPPVIELRAANAKEQKGYAAGDKIGDFTVVSFDRDTVTFDWNGEEVVRNFTDLKPKEAPAAVSQQQQAAAPPPQASAAPASKGVIAIGASDSDAASTSSIPSVVGPDVGGGYYGCKTGDTTPSGTVVSGFLKTSSQGLMGASCRWERTK